MIDINKMVIKNEQLVKVKTATMPQNKLTFECWGVQLWGLNECSTCEFRGKKNCGGKQIRKTGKNSLGFPVPVR